MKLKKIKKEYYLLGLLLVSFILLTILVVKGKTAYMDEAFYNFITTFKSEGLTNFLYLITQLASTLGIVGLLFITMFVTLSLKKYLILNIYY